MMSDASKAIFLSYARDDAAAARRIAEALRASGLEVWFDENELRGGDAWDQKIRTQIKECALFIPIISATTQERGEGYFRLEWKLAAERTHHMHEGMSFLVPLVVDDTAENRAAVPSEFMKVQWTRLPGALPSPQFVEQLKRLLEAPHKPVADVGRGRRTPPGLRTIPEPAGFGDPALQKNRSLPGWTWGALTAVGVAVALSTSRPQAPGAVGGGPSASGVERSAAKAAAEKSVAVLAFANLSDDKDNEYFSDGISEELLNVLAKVPGLKVTARTSSFHFKGTNTAVPEIARQLGVAYVMEGSVRKAGNRVRITAQLIKAADGFHVWSETYDRDLQDIFAVQDEIAKNILAAVRVSLLGGKVVPNTVSTKIEAYTLYLQAQGEFAKRGEFNLRAAIEHFERALAIDPNYVPALVGLARARVVLPSYSSLSGAQARETVDKAKQAARRALVLDPENSDAHATIGLLMSVLEWHWNEGEAELSRARELAPDDNWVANCFGDFYRFTRNDAASIAAKQQAWNLDPVSALSHWDIGYAYFVAGDYGQAQHWAELARGLAPDRFDGYQLLIMVAAKTGRVDQLRQVLAATRQNVRENAGLRMQFEVLGAISEKRPDEARRLLAQVETLTESGKASPAYTGYLHLLLGNSAEAMVWLRRGYDLRDVALVWSEIIDFDVIAADPVTRPILDQPGLKELHEIRQHNIRASQK